TSRPRRASRAPHPQRDGALFASMITSPDNQNLKDLRKLRRRAVRDRTKRFVAEGEDLIAAATAAGWEPLAGFCRAGLARGRPGWIEVDDGLLRSVSTLESGSREIAVYAQRWSEPSGPLCVYL